MSQSELTLVDHWLDDLLWSEGLHAGLGQFAAWAQYGVPPFPWTASDLGFKPRVRSGVHRSQVIVGRALSGGGAGCTSLRGS